ncbi:hypothetical protein [Flavobacterium sp.]|uniref:hypothetical protein n=1 Tax=Flavobacterium sp. TaxID=239 RepID=UPI00261D3FAE|nr:hypothetical protein [Flavobacterium sp.]
MKKGTLKLGLFSMILLGIVSCQNKEKEMADKRISELESYVDSLKTVDEMAMNDNWDQIASDYDKKSTSAEDALSVLNEKEKTSGQEKLDSYNADYNEMKASVEEKKEAVTPAIVAESSPNQRLRDRLFGAGKIGDDMSFVWVNKDNILKTYETFFQSYKDNKEDFSREDYDEIKLMYEALDNRKNTVEKEGLTSDDNNKIASIKLKFGPMFKVNRMGAKSRETAEAKE